MGEGVAHPFVRAAIPGTREQDVTRASSAKPPPPVARSQLPVRPHRGGCPESLRWGWICHQGLTVASAHRGRGGQNSPGPLAGAGGCGAGRRTSQRPRDHLEGEAQLQSPEQEGGKGWRGPAEASAPPSPSALRVGVHPGAQQSLSQLPVPICPQHLYNIESEIEESDYDSVEGSTSGASSDEWEDDSDSWETDNGLVEDEHPKIEEPPIPPAEQPAAPEEDKGVVISEEAATAAIQGAVAMAAPVAGLMEKAGKDGPPKSFRELKEAIKILESLKNMTVEQLLTGSPTSPTVEPEKPTREKKFLDDIKKLQENLKKTLDNVAIAEEEKMEAMPDTERREDKPEGQSPVKAEWPSETPVLCQQCGGKPGVTFTSAKGEVFSVLEFAPCEFTLWGRSPPSTQLLPEGRKPFPRCGPWCGCQASGCEACGVTHLSGERTSSCSLRAHAPQGRQLSFQIELSGLAIRG